MQIFELPGHLLDFKVVCRSVRGVLYCRSPQPLSRAKIFKINGIVVIRWK